MMNCDRRIAAVIIVAAALQFHSRTAFADSVIRLNSSSDDAGSVRQSESSSSAQQGGIRIIGDRQPAAEKTSGDSKPMPRSGGLIIKGDGATTTVDKEEAAKAEQVKKAALEQAAREKVEQIKKAAQEQATREKAEREKAELERKAAEKVEQERRDALKAEQEKALVEEIKLSILREQKELAFRKAEELRRAAEKAEVERRAALKAEEERLEAARKALLLKLRSESDMPTGRTAIDNGRDASDQRVIVTRVTPEHGTAPVATLSIGELFQLAKTNDPTLSRSMARVAGSVADSDMVFSGLLPHFDSSAGVKKISQTLANYNTPQNIVNDYTAINYNVSGRLTLLHMPTLYALSAADAALKSEKAGVVAARQNLIVRFSDAYFSLLKTQTDKEIALGEINRLKQVLDQAQAFLKAGTGDIIAVYEAQSRLDSANADLTKSESSLKLAEQKLSSLVGKPVSAIVNYLPQTPAGPEPDSLDWWVATMEKEQPLVKQAKEMLDQTSEQRKAAKSEYLPLLQASGGYDVNRGTPALPSAEVRQWFAGISMTLPLYSGGETSAKIRRAAASEDERRHILDDTVEQHRESVKQAYFNLRYNISLIKALDQKKTSAEIQLAAVKKGRKIGTRNAIDVLNAEQAYSMALRDHRYALYDNIIRVIQLKSAAGILGEEDVSGLAQMEAPSPDNGLNMIISKVAGN